MVSPEQLKQLIPNNQSADIWYIALLHSFPKYEINTCLREAAFLAQCIHESGEFRILKENLNYKADALMRVWPSRFPSLLIAQQYEHKPEAIANKVYSNRMGNGDETSGDGWLFRGRGLIQLTGRENYQAFADSIDMHILDVPTYLETPDGAVESACFFWKKNNLNEVSDTGDIDRVSKIVNGGKIGIIERKQLYEKITEILQCQNNQ